MSGKPKIIFTAFANPKKDLDQLNQEESNIQKILSVLPSDVVIHITRSNIESDDFFTILKQYQNRISIIHFAGHTSSDGLSLYDGDTFFNSLVDEIRLRCFKSLKLVVLNGCSTYSRVQYLLANGVNAVVATQAKINDEIAAVFASKFYANLCGKDNTPPDRLKDAFESSVNFVKSRYNSNLLSKVISRDILLETGPLGSEEIFPWVLCVRDKDLLELKLMDFIDDPPQPISFPGSSMIPTGIISEPIIKGQAENSSPVIGKDDFQKVINVSIQFSTTSNLNNLNFNYTLRP